jgi:hypothetical protein
MLSIKTLSGSASAERLAEQVQEETERFFEEQKENALKRLREQGLYFFPSGSEINRTNCIYIELYDEQGGKFWIPLKLGDEIRDSVGRCISCGLTIGSKQRSSCYMDCRNTDYRIYPLDGQPVTLATKSDKKWVLKREPNRFTLSQNHERPLQPVPRVAPRSTLQSILKAWFQ